jgi:hypothetical protein
MITRSEVFVLVNVNLEDVHAVADGSFELVEDRRLQTARSAPRCEKVHKNGLVS